MFQELYNSLTKGASWHQPDNYFLIYDEPDYVAAKLRAIADTADRKAFGLKCLHNIAGAGKFSSDRTIRQYASELWHYPTQANRLCRPCPWAQDARAS